MLNYKIIINLFFFTRCQATTCTSDDPVDKQVSVSSGIIFFNSLVLGRFGCDFENAIINFVLVSGIFRYHYDNSIRWGPRDLIGYKSIESVKTTSM